MKRSACLIFNPVAGQSDPDIDLNKIKVLLSEEIDLDIQFTTPEVDGEQLAKEAVARGVESIIASGGDGTISAVAGALLETNIPLGIISRGTANAFANALGIPDTIEKACLTILDGKTKIIDVARCNGKPMVLLAGIGFEAQTIDATDREFKNIFGKAAYLFSAFQKLADLATFETKIEVNEEVMEFNAAAVTVANAAPATSVLAQGPDQVICDDGLLDITIVAPNHQAAALAATYHLLQTAFQNEAAARNDISFLRAKRVKISTLPPQKLVLDGEVVGEMESFEIECIPDGLTIFVPPTV